MASGRSPMPSSSSHSRRRTSHPHHPSSSSSNNDNHTPANNYYSSSSLFTTPSNHNNNHLLTPSTFSPPKRRTSSSFMMDPFTTTVSKPMTTQPASIHTTTTTTGNNKQEDELVEMRKLVQETCQHYHPKLAIPYASLLYTKSNSLQDGILLAQTCIQSQQYTRALSILQQQLLPSSNMTTHHLQITTLIATCFMECHNYEEALTTLESYQHDTTTTTAHTQQEEEWLHQLLLFQKNNNSSNRELAWYCCQRGICLEELGNPTLAAFFFMKSLQFHVTCQLSWKMLCDKQLLTQSQLNQFLTNDLTFPTNHSWLKPFYLTQLSTTTTSTTSTKEEGDNEEDFLPNHSPNNNHNYTSSHETLTKRQEQKTNHNNNDDDGERVIQDAFEILEIKHDLKIKNSPELSSLAAIRAYEQNDLKTALYYCQQNLQQTTGTALFVHVSTLTALQHKRSLFALAHKLVHATSTTTINTGEEAAIAWYAVGCYYYSCQKYELAQRNFCRATRLAPKRAECWIAFGCSFSIVDESDQALASYRAAQKYTPSSPLPFLYMGMEYMRTNHSSLAKHFFTTAQSLSSTDKHNNPLLYNELGVWHYKQQDYTQAISYFQKALSSSSSSEQEFWEPTMFNLGQSYRKSKQYANALECFEHCISTCPGKACGYSALGFTHHLLGNMDDAIEQYHLALSRKPDDTFASEMLYRALQEAIQLPNENENENSLLFSSNQKQPPQKNINHTMMNMSATMISTTTPHLNNHHHTPIEQEDNEEQFSNFTFDHSDVDISMT